MQNPLSDEHRSELTKIIYGWLTSRGLIQEGQILQVSLRVVDSPSIQFEVASRGSTGELDKLLATLIPECELSPRTIRSLLRGNIHTLGLLARTTESDLTRLRGFNKRSGSFREVMSLLEKNRLSLGLFVKAQRNERLYIYGLDFIGFPYDFYGLYDEFRKREFTNVGLLSDASDDQLLEVIRSVIANNKIHWSPENVLIEIRQKLTKMGL